MTVVRRGPGNQSEKVILVLVATVISGIILNLLEAVPHDLGNLFVEGVVVVFELGTLAVYVASTVAAFVLLAMRERL